MNTLRYAIVGLLLLCAAYVVVMNWGCALASWRNRRRGIARHHSTVPLVSAVLTALAWLAHPGADKAWLFALPLLDIGNLGLLLLPWHVLGHRRRRSPGDEG